LRKENEMPRKGVIQNDELLRRAINEGKEFAIPCNDEKDAHSKRISLYNAKRLLSEREQRKVQITRECIDGVWFVKILSRSYTVYEIVDGKMVPVVEKLSESSMEMLKEMLEQEISREDIITILSGNGESVEAIEEALDGSN